MKKMAALLLTVAVLIGLLLVGMYVLWPAETQNTPTTGPVWTTRPTILTTLRPQLPTTSTQLPTTLPQWPTTLPQLPTTLPQWPTTLPQLPTTLPQPPTTLPQPPTTLPQPPTTLPQPPTTLPLPPTTVIPPVTTMPDNPNGNSHLPELDPGNLWEVTGADAVNIRADPYLGNNAIGKAPEGTLLELLGWDGKFAKIRFNGRTAYIMGNYIKPADKTYMQDALDAVEITGIYSYDAMMEDLVAFAAAYPQLVELEVAGYSELGNQIPVIRIGNPQAKYHVLLQGSIHGREHMTAWLLMAVIDYWLDRDLASYGDVCYHIIPMSNPDGVIISQSETMPDYLESMYQRDQRFSDTPGGVQMYLAHFKANALGVDLNRNFPAGWEYLSNVRKNPSCKMHPGTEPFSAAETRVLRDYTLRYNFDVTISYHATGSVIYYEYGKKQPVNSLSTDLGKKISALTGYTMLGSNTVGAGGYKDWAIDTLQIPSLTIEIGCQNTPLVERELYHIFARNCNVLPAIAQWLQK